MSSLKNFREKLPKTPMIRTTAVLVSPIILSGCLYYGFNRGLLKPDRPPAPAPTSYFNYTPLSAAPKLGTVRQRPGFTMQRAEFEAPPETNLFKTVSAFYYRPDGAERKPALIILPITQGDYYTKEFAAFLAANGYVCLRYQSRGELFKIRQSPQPLLEFEATLRSYVIHVRRGLDWLARQPEVDPDRIGIMGISFGAISGMLTMEVEPRIRSGVFILGGGNLPGILTSSTEPSIQWIQKYLRDVEDLSDDELLQEVSSVVGAVDPMNYADRLDPSRILMINAWYDAVIKRRHVKQLWEKASRPPLIFLPTGHYSAGLLFPYAESKTLDHFNRTLKSP
jgi:hypothetical protein